MTPDQLREWNATRPFPHPNEAQEIIFEGHRCVVMDPECYEECFKQAESHAAALEEIERLNAAWKAQQFHLEAEERECAHWQERAEKAERRAERLKGHAEAMDAVLSWLNSLGGLGYDKHSRIESALAAYRAEFKGE